MAKQIKVRAPSVYLPAPIDVATVQAIRAVGAGEGSEDQQKKALHWIIHYASNYGGDTFIPDVDGGSHYMAGRRSVGVQIVDAMVGSLDRFRNKGETW